MEFDWSSSNMHVFGERLNMRLSDVTCDIFAAGRPFPGMSFG